PAPWDARPKFLHTRPDAACVTRLELDHPDIYPTIDAYRRPFVDLAAALPLEGVLALCADDPECVALSTHAAATVVTYGTGEGADWSITDITWDRGLQRFTVTGADAPPVQVALTFPGRHNAL